MEVERRWLGNSRPLGWLDSLPPHSRLFWKVCWTCLRRAVSFLGLSAAGGGQPALTLEVCLQHWQPLRQLEQEPVLDSSLQSVACAALHHPQEEGARGDGGPLLGRSGARRGTHGPPVSDFNPGGATHQLCNPGQVTSSL